MGWMNKINLNMNKLLLIHAAQSAIQSNNMLASGFSRNKFGLLNENKEQEHLHQMSEQIDVEKFISISKLFYKFNYQSKCLGFLVHSYWQRFLVEVFNPNQIFQIGDEISENIKCIYKYFYQIDTECQQKNYKIYQQFSFIQKLLLNDQHMYELYLGKMKGILMMQKINKNSYSNRSKLEFDIGIMQVQGKFSSFGKIMFVNHILIKLAKYRSQSELKHVNMDIFLPSMIKQFHSRMIERYKQTGEQGVFNRDMNQFIISKEGYLELIEINIKYYYSSANNEHTYIAFVTPTTTLRLDTNGISQQNVRNILFMMFDNDDGRIYDINKQCTKYLGLNQDHLMEGALMRDKNYICIGDIFPDILIEEIKQDQKMVISGDMSFNLNVMKTLHSLNHRDSYQKGQCQYQIFKESYCNNAYQINILALVLSNQLYKSVDKDISYKQSKQIQLLDTEDPESYLQFNSSINDSSQSSSTTRDASETLKNKYTSMEINTPRSLKIVLQLTLILFMASLVLSSVIYFLSKNQQIVLQSKMLEVQAGYDKVESNSKISVRLRTYLNILNGYEENQSTVLPERLSQYQGKLVGNSQEMTQFQSTVDQAVFNSYESLVEFVQKKAISLQYLDEYNQVYYENYTMTIAENDFSAKLMTLLTYDPAILNGNLSFLTLTPNVTNPYKPTDIERQLFYLINNGIDSLRVQNWNYAEMFSNDTIQHVEDYKSINQMILLISLSTIVAILMVLVPFVYRIMDRKYKTLEVFTFIKKESIIQIMKQSKECMISMLEEGNRLETKTDKNEKQKSEEINSSKEYETTSYNRSRLQSNSMLRSDYSERNENDFTFKKMQIDDSNMDNSNSNLNESNNMMSHQLKHQQLEEIDVIKYHTGYIKPKDEEKSKRTSNYLVESLQSESTSKDQEQVIVEIVKKIDIPPIDNSKQMIIKKLRGASKVLTLFFAILSMAILCVYFLTSFKMTTATFDQVGSVLSTVYMIYQKDSCIDNLIAYFRESQFRNESMPLFEDPTQIATTYYIQKCMGIESDYLKIRIDVPEAIKSITGFMDLIESDQMCGTIFSDDEVNELLCTSAFYGILNKGLSNVIGYIIEHFEQEDLKFNSNKHRTQQDLENFISDNTTVEIIDIKNFLLDALFDMFKDKVTFEYFALMLAQYEIVFQVYAIAIILFILVFVFIVFKRIRARLFNLSILMKIFPIAMLPPEKTIQVKDFFNSQ